VLLVLSFCSPEGLETLAGQGTLTLSWELESADGFCVSTGLKAFRQQLRKNARTKGFLGLNKIKGLARQVCQSSSNRASRGGLSALHAPAQSPGLQGSSVSGRESRNLLEEVLHQQR
jgi:serine/threonine-protein kinase SIK1